MGRYKIYRSTRELTAAVEGYFRSISRTETVMEPVGTGELDKYGHEIMGLQPVLNDDGEEIRQRVFHIPPTRGGMCAYLGISNNTWLRYCDREENPKFAEITEWAEDQLLNWRTGQLLVRSGKHIRGLELEMDMNFGRRSTQTVEIRSVTRGNAEELPKDEREALLSEIVSRFRGDDHGGEEIHQG